LNEQYGNVYENKGSVFEGRGKNRNVIENKGSYTLMAGMLMKRKVVSQDFSPRTGKGGALAPPLKGLPDYSSVPCPAQSVG
jgi:hypothetical protein